MSKFKFSEPVSTSKASSVAETGFPAKEKNKSISPATANLLPKEKKNPYAGSLKNLKDVRCMAVTSLLIAMNICMDLLGLTIKVSPTLRIGFGFLCNATIGMLYGPVVGMLGGACTDILGYFAGNMSMGAYFPGCTLTAVVGGLIWGLWLYPARPTLPRVIGAKACINLICNIGLNTLWLSITGGKAMSALLLVRVQKNLILLPLEVMLAALVLKPVTNLFSKTEKSFRRMQKAS